MSLDQANEPANTGGSINDLSEFAMSRVTPGNGAVARSLVPATAMGATLPVLVGILSSRDPNFGAVLGRVYGWNTLPYLGTGEFYTNFGTYDVRITAPRDHIVVATGVLQNEAEVYTEELARLLQAGKAGSAHADFYAEARRRLERRGGDS